MIRTDRAEGGVDGEIVGELQVSGPFNACHALPLRLLTFSVTKFLGISPARLSKGHVFDERKVRPSFGDSQENSLLSSVRNADRDWQGENSKFVLIISGIEDCMSITTFLLSTSLLLTPRIIQYLQLSNTHRNDKNDSRLIPIEDS